MNFDWRSLPTVTEKIEVLETILGSPEALEGYDLWLASKVKPLSFAYDRRGNIERNLRFELRLLKRRLANQAEGDKGE